MKSSKICISQNNSKALHVVTLPVGQKGKMLHCLSVSSGCLSVRRHVRYPRAEFEGSLLSKPFLTPILELWYSWSFLIIEVESCVSKKSLYHLSTFLILSTIVFEGFAILPSRTPANIFRQQTRAQRSQLLVQGHRRNL